MSSSLSTAVGEEGATSRRESVERLVLRRLEGGGTWSMSALGREERSSASDSSDGGSDRSDEVGEGGMMSLTLPSYQVLRFDVDSIVAAHTHQSVVFTCPDREVQSRC